MSDKTQSYEERRRREVVADIERLGREMASLDLRLRLFREHNFVSMNGRLSWKLSALTQRAEAESSLRKLESERDELLKTWHKILAEHAALAP